jgi:hypothetical protein
MDLRLDEYQVVQPGIFFVSDDNSNCTPIGNKYWQGQPDLVARWCRHRPSSAIAG